MNQKVFPQEARTEATPMKKKRKLAEELENIIPLRATWAQDNARPWGEAMPLRAHG